MKRDITRFLNNSPQFGQPDQLHGIFKGYIVDVRDPFMLGQVRVWCYALHGDTAKLDVDALPWAMIPKSVRGAFGPPELFDQALVSFECGDRYTPIVLGYWDMVPAGSNGTGALPNTAAQGSSIRPEAWHSHDLYPEALILGASGIGNAAWLESKIVGGSNVASVVEMEDTGGRLFKTKSYHIGSQPWMSQPSVPSGPGGLQGGFGQPGQAIRTGAETVPSAVSGQVSLGGPNLLYVQMTDDQDFTMDVLADAGGTSIQTVSGKVRRVSVGDAELTMSMGIVNIPSGVGLDFTTCPKRWD
jgi:Type VI secretion system/phage-baseplate injector OB domain